MPTAQGRKRLHHAVMKQEGGEYRLPFLSFCRDSSQWASWINSDECIRFNPLDPRTTSLFGFLQRAYVRVCP